MNDLMREIPDQDRREAFDGFPLEDADLCVKCGLCLPHCPTYKDSRHEGDSPRGRIALMQGLARGQLEPEGSTTAHLDGCLVCRACEPVCPAQVPYGRLIDAGRSGLWQSGHRPGLAWRWLAIWRRTPARLRWLQRGIRLLHVSRLARALSALPLGGLARMLAYLRSSGRPPGAGLHATTAASRGTVRLFLGCIARAQDAGTLRSAVRVMNAMGWDVDVPAAQACCGAMDAHAGDKATAARLAHRNIRAFSGDEPVLSTASGCGVQLQDYPELDIEAAGAFAARVRDVMTFVAANADALPALNHAPASVAVHAPCTLRNGMRESGALEVLATINGLDVKPLRHADCCGAAGSYVFEHPATADRLGDALLDSFEGEWPDIFVTSNIGCALHLERLASRRGARMKVMHPVQLLAESLPAGNDREGI